MTTVAIISSEPTLTATTERAVRFDDECVLIPEPQPRSRLPRLITKSYSLPLWRRRGSDGSETELASPADDYIAFKVSVPSLTTKSLSPTRDEFIPQSCLVQQNSSIPSPPRSPPHPYPVRRASSLSSPRLDLVTVPLRPCCADCEIIWEECMKEGEEWKERFTRGARRRRSSSSDAPRALLHDHHHHASKTGSYPFTGGFSIKVDEVDQKRQSLEKAPIHFEDGISTDNDPEIVGVVTSMASLAPPIQEEDEDQLFPLPSPKRSPCASPIPSPTASSSSLASSGVKDSPGECAIGATKMKTGTLLTPARTALWSPPSASLSRISDISPLPVRNISPLPLPSDLDFLEADKLLSSPALSRASRSSTFPSHQKKPPKGSLFAKAGSGILKGVIGLGSPPMI